MQCLWADVLNFGMLLELELEPSQAACTTSNQTTADGEQRRGAADGDAVC